MIEVAIVGAGLSGLALANTLSLAGCGVQVFEARDRVGGRIRSVTLADGGRADLGPTWFWPEQQRRMAGLVEHLGLDVVRQHEAGSHMVQSEPGAEPKPVEQDDVHANAARLAGGMAVLTDTLAARLPETALHLEHVLTSVFDCGTHVALDFATPDGPQRVEAVTVVFAMPPRLIESSVIFEPALPPQVRVAMREMPTWMAAQAKFVAGQHSDFWRTAGRSGTAVAPYASAVLGEVWDACDESGHAALAAFVGLNPEQRASFASGLPMLAASQLVQFFGPDAEPTDTHVQDWATEPMTCAELDRMQVAEHPTDAPEALQRPCWQGRVHFCGSETAAYAPGYMEGALESAGRVHKALAAYFRRAA